MAQRDATYKIPHVQNEPRNQKKKKTKKPLCEKGGVQIQLI